MNTTPLLCHMVKETPHDDDMCNASPSGPPPVTRQHDQHQQSPQPPPATVTTTFSSSSSKSPTPSPFSSSSHHHHPLFQHSNSCSSHHHLLLQQQSLPPPPPAAVTTTTSSFISSPHYPLHQSPPPSHPAEVTITPSSSSNHHHLLLQQYSPPPPPPAVTTTSSSSSHHHLLLQQSPPPPPPPASNTHQLLQEHTVMADCGGSKTMENVAEKEVPKTAEEKVNKAAAVVGKEAGSTGVQVLDEVTVEAVVKYIKSGECKSIITMAGAGISTSAGIPDFRTPGSGLYSNLEKYNLPFPEAIFDIEFFKTNPQPFFVLAKELYPGAFNPTPSHWFVRLLHDKGLLLRHYTQNIDTLEHVAGLPAEKTVEAHGTFRTSHCIACRKEYSQEWMKEEIFKDSIPTCSECSGLVKPDIVFFRENLPPRFFHCVQSDFPKCDLLIILGTSLTVQPFASLIDNVPPSCPRLLINREKTGSVDPVMAILHGIFTGGLALDSPNNKRDVALLGDCDDGCKTFAEMLGWKEDLEKLVATKK
ncbi:NAD-dependent protein deacetylase sirtuin-2-like [Homarus americanus]|uniref:NAD-dependent protein deacetylase sirtuin-2-like n=1 Tax=Homarus americanus TaxID=6706 RepID=A0A8J5KC18_HOMAM|nr:NAD-dependent protein deacetylase sirtuin-2-like [Homarus americanus]